MKKKKVEKKAKKKVNKKVSKKANKKENAFRIRIGHPILRKGVSIEAIVRSKDIEKVVSDLIEKSSTINAIEISEEE